MSFPVHKKYFAKRVVNWVVENLKDSFGYCCRNNLTLNQYLPPERFGNSKNQITVFISVRLSELWENSIFEAIKEMFGQLEIPISKVSRWTTSDGDIKILNDVYEIKTSQAKDSWTGATHSSHKSSLYILVHYSIDRDKNLDLLNGNEVFPEFSIYLSSSKLKTKEIWNGIPKENSSFTTLRIENEWIKEGNVLCIFGNLDSSKGKYAKIIHEKNPNL
ncbi:MAG: hypothetical protein LBF02_02065 [Mycoplasmataceae bacterium]|nr:hypothetical protein [Mycoplasmataceae bacterium]